MASPTDSGDGRKPYDAAPATANVTPPTKLGNYVVTAYELVSDKVWHGRGDGFVARVELIGKRSASATKSRLETRVRALHRLLGKDVDRGLLRPIECGVSAKERESTNRFVWMIAESPGPSATAWTPTYRALDSLADTLRFLHDRRFLHGGVALENLWLCADGRSRLAPWAKFERQSEPVKLSRILTHTFAAVPDVQGLIALLPSDGHYDELRRRATGEERLRPLNGLALLHLLRATPPGQAYAASFDGEAREEQLRQLASEWLSRPPFMPPGAWGDLKYNLGLKTHLSIELRGGWGCGKTRWLTEIAEVEHARDAIVAAGLGATREGALIEALEDLREQGYLVADELAAARGGLDPLELTDALVRATKKIAPEHRLVWLFDDVDAAEQRTAKALQGFRRWAVSQGPAFGLDGQLLVMTAETHETEREGAPQAVAEPGFHRVVIERLPPNTIKELLASLIGLNTEADAFAGVVAEEAKGKPYHAVELLRTLLSEGAVVLLGATTCTIHWERLRLDKPDEVRPRPQATIDTFMMPSEVMAVLGRRFAALDPLATAVLRALAVDGHDVELSLLAAVLGEPPDEIEDVAHELQAAGLVELQAGATSATESESDGTWRARVRDAQIKKYFRESMSDGDRRFLHGRFLAIYQQQWAPLDAPGPLGYWSSDVNAADRREREGWIAILAEHALAAGASPAIAMWVPLAAASCRRRSDLRSARAFYKQAITSIEPGTRELLHCQIALSEILRINNELGAAEETYPQILEECGRLGDSWARAHGLLGIAGVHFARGQFEQMRNRACEAHEMATAVKDPVLTAMCQDYLARAENRLGDKYSARTWCERALTTYREIADEERCRRMLHLLAALMIDEGNYDEARGYLASVQVALASCSDRRQLIWVYLAEARLALECGQYAASIVSCKTAVAEAKAIGDNHLQCLGRLAMALAAMSRSEYKPADRGLAALSRADYTTASRELKYARRLVSTDESNYYLQAVLAWHESWLHFRRREYVAATKFAERTLELTDMSGDRSYCGFAAATLGCVALNLGQLAGARVYFDQAMTEASGVGNRFCRHLFATDRAQCEIRAWYGKQACDLPLARALLQEALAFSGASGAVDVKTKALIGLASLTEIGARAQQP